MSEKEIKAKVQLQFQEYRENKLTSPNKNQYQSVTQIDNRYSPSLLGDPDQTDEPLDHGV